MFPIYLCCLHPFSSLKSLTSAAKKNVSLFTTVLRMNTIPLRVMALTLPLMNMVLKVIFESMSQYRWCERLSSELPLNAKRLSHKLGLREELWKSMDPWGSVLCVNDVCAYCIGDCCPTLSLSATQKLFTPLNISCKMCNATFEKVVAPVTDGVGGQKQAMNSRLMRRLISERATSVLTINLFSSPL